MSKSAAKLKNYFKISNHEKVFIPIITNTKNPICKYKNLNSTPYDIFLQLENYNTAILTGSINKIIVVDVDLYKDGATEKWNKILKFMNLEKDFNTLTVKTPRGGKHYYFNYTTQLPGIIGLDGFIDIKSDGGYVLCPPSIINESNYKIINDTEPIDMPVKLIKNLLNYYKKKDVIHNYNLNQSNDKYIITDKHMKELTDILNGLPQEYVDDYNKWRPICKALQNSNLFSLADKWSKKSKKYNKIENAKRLKQECKIDIGYIYALGRENNIKFDQSPNKYVEFIDITRDIKKCIHDDSLFINTNEIIKIVNENDIISIKSPTGSGKSDNTKALLNYILTNNLVENKKILSIVSRVTLAYQQDAYFNDTKQSIAEKNINLEAMKFNFVNYDKSKDKPYKDAEQIIIQIDSLLKTGDNYGILILDEFSNIINHLVTSSTLKNKRIDLIIKFLKICKSAEKIITLDANFNDNCIYFLENVIENKSHCLYWNKCQNLKNVKINFLETDKFDDVFHSYIKKDKSFIFASNEKRYIDKYSGYSNDNKRKVFTCDEGDRSELLNTKDWNTKQIYHSPSLIYGIDLNFKNDVFLYCTDSTLDADQLIQQMTRCRQIDNAYICINTKFRPTLFKSIKDVKEYYSCFENYGELDGTDRELFNNNIKYESDIRIHFSNIWAYEKMKKSILINSIKIHITNILMKRGATIIDNLIIDKIEKNEIVSNIDTNELFLKYAHGMVISNRPKMDKKYNIKCEDIENKYKLLWNKKGDFSVMNKEDYKKFLELLVYDDKLSIHFNIRYLLCKDISNYDKLEYIEDNELKENIYTNSLSKVIMYKKLCNSIDNETKIDNDLLKSIIKTFNIRQTKLNLEKIKRTIQKELFGDLYYITITRPSKTKRQYNIQINEELVKFHLKIYSLSSYLSSIDNQYEKIIQEIISEKKDRCYFMDEYLEDSQPDNILPEEPNPLDC